MCLTDTLITFITIVFVTLMVTVSGSSSVHRNLQHVHRRLCWCIDLLNIVFTFLWAVFCDDIHPLGFLKGEEFLDWWSNRNHVRKKGSSWRLFVNHVFKLL
jgi:hypothetical protein